MSFKKGEFKHSPETLEKLRKLSKTREARPELKAEKSRKALRRRYGRGPLIPPPSNLDDFDEMN